MLQTSTPQIVQVHISQTMWTIQALKNYNNNNKQTKYLLNLSKQSEEFKIIPPELHDQIRSDFLGRTEFSNIG